ncbi:MAG: 30S ribosome-binding factor RbfA [Chlamydiae bacterium]|nr:30S ribosome-binding factor RbfA [Chlamydiota bacterium]
MAIKRAVRLNSLLKEVISEVVMRDVRDPRLPQFVTITGVEITNDLHYAKVSVSVIGTPEQKIKTIEALQSAAGFIAVQSSKKVVMRYFPELTFKIDDSVEQHIRIESLLSNIHKEQKSRAPNPDDDQPS